MNSVLMSYRGVSFSVNPKTVKTGYAKTLAVSLPLSGNAAATELAAQPATVSGRGSFCGKNARAQAQTLLSVFQETGSAWLFTPVLSPMKAFFTALEFSVDAAEEKIDFTFTFTEDKGKTAGRFDFGYTVAQAGENLFDIAARTGVPIETVMERNDFETPFAVKEGERVWLK